MSILDLLMDETGLGQEDLLRIIRSAPVRYKVYTIPKRTGGERLIAQPSKALKVLQRIIVTHVLAELPVHDAAAAYRVGKSIRDNAAAHTASNFLLKLDFVNFFNCLMVKDWDAYVRRTPNQLSTEDKYVLKQLLFYGGGQNRPNYLSVGAPSSPAISNVLMFHFDDLVSKRCDQLGVVFTRYADDITLSGPAVDALLIMEREIERILAKMRTPRLTLKPEKRGLYSRAGRRMVTGLVLTQMGEISLGRERKREISAMVDHVRRGVNPSIDHMFKTKGYLGFAISCEPSFVNRLRAKYGDAVIDNILKFTPPIAP